MTIKILHEDIDGTLKDGLIVNREGKKYYLNGMLHRENGPAIEPFEGRPSYYLLGQNFSKEDYNRFFFEDLEGRLDIKFLLDNIEFLKPYRVKFLEDYCMDHPKYKLMYLKEKL